MGLTGIPSRTFRLTGEDLSGPFRKLKTYLGRNGQMRKGYPIEDTDFSFPGENPPEEDPDSHKGVNWASYIYPSLTSMRGITRIEYRQPNDSIDVTIFSNHFDDGEPETKKLLKELEKYDFMFEE